MKTFLRVCWLLFIGIGIAFYVAMAAGLLALHPRTRPAARSVARLIVPVLWLTPPKPPGTPPRSTQFAPPVPLPPPQWVPQPAIAGPVAAPAPLAVRCRYCKYKLAANDPRCEHCGAMQ